MLPCQPDNHLKPANERKKKNTEKLCVHSSLSIEENYELSSTAHTKNTSVGLKDSLIDFIKLAAQF